MRRKQRTVESVNGLPPELAAGPDPAVWTPTPLPVDTYSPSHDERVRSAAYHAWCSAGDDWNTAQGLPSRHWRSLLRPDVQYLTTALGRSHVVGGGLGPPWQRRST